MTTGDRLDVVFVSYLADAHVLRVPAYPRANHGAIITQTAGSVAADGPLAAAIGAGLGMRVGLIANPVGEDPAGRHLLDWLASAGIRHDIGTDPHSPTPQLTVVADDAGSRTWFANLQRAFDHLHTVDLALMSRATVVYVDCYQAIAAAAARAVAASASPLLLNLGGDPLDDDLVAAAAGRSVLAVQTSLDEADAVHAEALATSLFDRLRPAAAVVTLGRLGALALTVGGFLRVEAPRAAVTHTHGAGAAFSAGYAYALLRGAATHGAVVAGCRAGTDHCVSPAAAIPRHLPDATFAPA